MKPWLYGIARNVWRKHCASAARLANNTEFSENNEDKFKEIPSATTRPEKALLNKEAGQILEAAVAALPDDYREILVLRFWEDLDYAVPQRRRSADGFSPNCRRNRGPSLRRWLRARLW